MSTLATGPRDGCGCGEAPASGPTSLERTRYQAGMIVTADDLTQDQLHWRERHRRHNRLLHGWGIVCGAGVVAVPGSCRVRVRPGHVLGPWGDEIVIDREVEVDVCREDPQGLLSCGEPDPWCSDVVRPRGETLYLAVRHLERPTRPVRMPGDPCGCDGDACAYSRTREGFALAVLDELPSSHRGRKVSAEAGTSAAAALIGLASSLVCLGGPRPCPPCEEEPWVVLADLELADGAVRVRCAPNRRYVVAFGHYAFRCDPRAGGAAGGLLGAIGGSAIGPSKIVAMEALEEAPATRTTSSVAMRMGGRWLALEPTMEVHDGETLGDVLAREGDRPYVDTATGETYTLREIYTAAGIDTARPVSGVAEALAPLEAREPDVSGLRVVRARLGELLADAGARRLDAEHAGAPAAAPGLPAADLAEVESGTPLARVADGMSVAEVAALTRSAFVSRVRRRASAAAREEAVAAAGRAWDAARAVTRLGEAWAPE